MIQSRGIKSTSSRPRNEGHLKIHKRSLFSRITVPFSLVSTFLARQGVVMLINSLSMKTNHAHHPCRISTIPHSPSDHITSKCRSHHNGWCSSCQHVKTKNRKDICSICHTIMPYVKAQLSHSDRVDVVWGDYIDNSLMQSKNNNETRSWCPATC